MTVKSCFKKRFPPGDGSRVAPQQDADQVFLLFDGPLQVGNHGPGPIHQIFRHEHGGLGIPAIVEARLDQLEGLFPDLDGALADLKLLVQGPELDIGPGQVGHQGLDNEFAVLLGGEKFGLGGFRGPADAAEEVDFPGEIAEDQAGQPLILRRQERCKPLSEVRMVSIWPLALTVGKRKDRWMVTCSRAGRTRWAAICTS